MTPERRLEHAVQRVGASTNDTSTLERAKAAALAELSRTPKARSWWVDALGSLALNLVMGITGAVLMSANDSQHHSAMTKYSVATGWFAFMALASVLWLRPASAHVRWTLVGAFATASVLTVLGVSGFDPGGPFLSGIWCALTECKIALVPVVLVVLLSTRFAVKPTELILGSLAAAAGGAVALHFHCPNGTLAHIGLFHVAPALVLAALALLARRWMKPASYAP